MRAHELAHRINYLLMRELSPQFRLAVLDYVRTGFDGESGEAVAHAAQQDAAIRSLDCDRQCFACDDRVICLSELEGAR